ncbi:hypothetical protein Tco_1192898 [Tanacetum coccineum]
MNFETALKKFCNDSIKITRSKTNNKTTLLLAIKLNLKAQIQENLGENGVTITKKHQLLDNLMRYKSKRVSNAKQRVMPSQVDVNKILSKPVTQHYFPKKTESAFAKPDHMIASSSSRNSSKNMPRFSLNDMVHNHYLDVARKKTQERDRNSKTSMMPSARFQSTADGSKPKPRSNNRSFVWYQERYSAGYDNGLYPKHESL